MRKFIKFKCKTKIVQTNEKQRHAHLVQLTPFSQNIEKKTTSSERNESNASIAFEFHNKKATTSEWITLTMTAVKLRFAVKMCSPKKNHSNVYGSFGYSVHAFWSFAIDVTVCQHTKNSIYWSQKNKNKTNNIFII